MTAEPMTRRNYFIPPAMLERMREQMQRTGMPEAELVRRAIEAYLQRVNL